MHEAPGLPCREYAGDTGIASRILWAALVAALSIGFSLTLRLAPRQLGDVKRGVAERDELATARK